VFVSKHYNITVQLKRCSAAPANTQVSCSLPTLSNTTCNTTCTLGYTPSVTPLKLFCFDGTWSGGSCVACPKTATTAISLTAPNSWSTWAPTLASFWIGFGWIFNSSYTSGYELGWSNIVFTVNYTCNATTTIKSTTYKPPTSYYYENGIAVEPPYTNGITGDIWPYSVNFTNPCNGAVHIKTITMAASLQSNVTMNLTAQFHDFIPAAKTTTIGDQNMTSWCTNSANFANAKYNATCAQPLWSPAVKVPILGCTTF